MDTTSVLITGSSGFLGSNLRTILKSEPHLQVIEYDADSPPEVLEKGLSEADVIFHLAGVNRPENVEEFQQGNTDLTVNLCNNLQRLGRAPKIVFSSSIQANLDNPYGISKRKAEDALRRFAEKTGSRITIFRLKNIFGKWCRPNYNSVVATFCYNIARDLPIFISDPTNSLELIYVDDVCSAMIESSGISQHSSSHLVRSPGDIYTEVKPAFITTLGQIADVIKSFRDSRWSLRLPAFDDSFVTRLYATYVSYLEDNNLSYKLDLKSDIRGGLAEFLKSPSFGQIFVSHTKPEITRGNHYHHSKTEKFLVLQGQAIIRLRHLLEERVIEYRVSGQEFQVVDIPAGYVHSIENVGEGELVTLFWADEIFDPDRPDAFYESVLQDGGKQ